MTIAEIMKESNHNAKAKGFWDEPVRTFGDQVALMHSELSEALEEFRDYGLDPKSFFRQWEHDGDKGKPEGIAAELADVIIRIADTCQHYGIPLERAIRSKMSYNRTRPHKHGGKVI